MTEELPELSQGLPVFPLPGVTLFPHTHLPLHIFEERYRNLIEDTLKGPEPQHCFAMGTLVDPSDETFGDPAVSPFAGVGRIAEYSRMDDGRFMVALRGIGRVRLTDERSTIRGYRVFDAEWLPDHYPTPDGRWERNLGLELKGLALALLRDQAERFRNLLAGEIDLGVLADMICGYLPFSPEFKLHQMGVPNVIERAAAIIGRLETMAGVPPGKPLRLDEDPPEN